MNQFGLICQQTIDKYKIDYLILCRFVIENKNVIDSIFFDIAFHLCDKQQKINLITKCVK